MAERIVAFLIDIALVSIFLILITATLGRLLVLLIGVDDFLNVFLYAFLPIALLLTYFGLCEYYLEGRTAGKALLKLRTVRADGESPTLETFAIRAVMQFVDFFLSLGMLGFLSAMSSPLRQRVGDRIAQTVVVRANPRTLYQLNDILAIKTVEEHIVRFPNAVELTIEQALTLKEVIVRNDRRPNPQVDVLVADTAQRVALRLQVELPRARAVEFLRQVLRDFIVLTR